MFGATWNLLQINKVFILSQPFNQHFMFSSIPNNIYYQYEVN